ncbi:MAG: methyltransferase domain-containing protein [Planctomycetes bacterium]|nr:methyltransferase domain-containing protein [Planctomycetota bacterium]
MTVIDELHAQHRWRGWQRYYERLPLRPGDRVLDLGCAIGDQAADLAARGARVHGIDGHDEFLRFARQRGIPHATFDAGDLRTWCEPSLRADGLWSSFAAAYFPDFSPVLRRWIMALRPGAFVALTEVDDLFGHHPLPRNVRARLEAYCDDARTAGRYDFRMGSRLRDCVEDAGLSVVEVIAFPDAEFAFAGRASPEVLDGWRRRLDRMALLQQWFGTAWPAARGCLLDCLDDGAHESSCRVVFVLARVPA